MGEGFVAVASGKGNHLDLMVLVAPFQFVVEQQSQEFQWSQLLIDCLGNAHIQGVEDAGEIELA
jgi:hypothetical protein